MISEKKLTQEIFLPKMRNKSTVLMAILSWNSKFKKAKPRQIFIKKLHELEQKKLLSRSQWATLQRMLECSFSASNSAPLPVSLFSPKAWNDFDLEEKTICMPKLCNDLQFFSTNRSKSPFRELPIWKFGRTKFLTYLHGWNQSDSSKYAQLERLTIWL